MTTARAILLEVKRRLGDTNTPYPDEADALAYLNRALQGIYNYGVYKCSPVLRRIEEFTTDAAGTAAVPNGICSIRGVADKGDKRILAPLDGVADVMSAIRTDKVSPWYTSTPNSISVYPAADEVKTLVVDYIPAFSKLTGRGASVPFTPDLDNVVVDWTVALISGKQQGVSDVEFATVMGYGNTLSRFFRGASSNLITGQGPW